MFRNMYDTDVTVWSPQGRIHQVEYAMEAVKQGSACVGIRSNKYAVLCAFRRQPSELASYQKKLIEVDSHCGIAVAGLTADARSLAKYMRSECLNYRYNFNESYPVMSLVKQVSLKHQKCTQQYVRRPYGVGLLVIGYDKSGAHLLETCPSGNYFDYYADSIGSKSQSARTYLNKLFDDKDNPTFLNCTLEELIKYSIEALNGCTQGDKPLTIENTSVSIVGEGIKYRELSDEELSIYIKGLKQPTTGENIETEETKTETNEIGTMEEKE